MPPADTEPTSVVQVKTMPARAFPEESYAVVVNVWAFTIIGNVSRAPKVQTPNNIAPITTAHGVHLFQAASLSDAHHGSQVNANQNAPTKLATLRSKTNPCPGKDAEWKTSSRLSLVSR